MPQQYLDSPDRLNQLYRRTLLIVILSQIFSGAGLAAGVTVGALLAQDMMGTESFAGIPVALITAGSAAAAMLVGRMSQSFGRRLGLTAGFLVGGLGAAGVVLAAITNSLPLLFVSLLIYGAGTSSNMQARYAGTDLAKPAQRATAVSAAMVSTTFGAVAGPNLVGVMGEFASAIGIPALSGPFILASAAFILAGLIIGIFLRPDPFLVAKALSLVEAKKSEQNDAVSHQAASVQGMNRRGIIVGASVMLLSQLVMVAIMTMTPIHMLHHGHGLNEVGFVISMHICAMYLPSRITGVLTDKLGRAAISYASGAVLLAAGLMAAAVPADSMILLTVALALLGLGWNLGFISGTAMIVDATTPATRAKTQGTIDVLIALVGASGGALSGIVAAQTSFAILSIIGALLSLLLIPVVIWSRRKRRIELAEHVSL